MQDQIESCKSNLGLADSTAFMRISIVTGFLALVTIVVRLYLPSQCTPMHADDDCNQRREVHAGTIQTGPKRHKDRYEKWINCPHLFTTSSKPRDYWPRQFDWERCLWSRVRTRDRVSKAVWSHCSGEVEGRKSETNFWAVISTSTWIDRQVSWRSER